jgi:hypothetical protein
MVLIIIQDPGHGDSTLAILLILAGVSVGDIVPAGSVLVMDTAMDMVMDMATGVMAGGVLPFIIPPVGVAGMEVQDLMASMEIHSMCTIISM